MKIDYRYVLIGIITVTLTFFQVWAGEVRDVYAGQTEYQPLPPPVYEEIIVQFHPGLTASETERVSDDQLERLNNAVALKLTWLRITRTGGQVLKLPTPMSREAVEKMLASIRMLKGVLWAEPLSAAATSQTLSQSTELTEPEESIEQLIVKLKHPDAQQAAEGHLPLTDAILAELSQVAGIRLAYARPMSGGAHVLTLPQPVTLSEARIITQRLEASGLVQYADPVTTLKLMRQPDDPLYPLQWHYFESPGGVNLPPAWDITTGSSSVVVAVLDSGILTHPDLEGRVLPGYDMISNPFVANDGDGRDPNPADPGDWVTAAESFDPSSPFYQCPATQSSWHGIHVAGLIGAASNNSRGVAGVTWDAKVLPVRVLGKCGGMLSDVVDGIRWSVGLEVPGVPANSNPAKVINMSLGGGGPCFFAASLQDAINAALAKGAAVVVAAGNENANAALYIPAGCPGVITVAANNRSGDKTSYTNYGPAVEISAPGGDALPAGNFNLILSTYNEGLTIPAAFSYQTLAGTSFAAPHVAGIAALMMSVNPALTPARTLAYLQGAAQPFAAGTWCAANPDQCGAGIADAGEAVQLAEQAENEQTVTVFEFHNVNLNHYFITASPEEAAGIKTGAAGPGWTPTLLTFKAYPLDDAPADSAPVCRFYGTPGIGPNSHFFTADAGECQFVQRDPGWALEGLAFSINTPDMGKCAAGTQPVYRVYNNRWLFNDSNHRYTTDYATYQDMINQGWLAEGIVMCAPL